MQSPDAVIDFSRSSVSAFPSAQNIFQSARVNSNASDMLFYFGDADPFGRLKAVSGTTAGDWILFDPFSAASDLQWRNVRWLILKAPRCLDLQTIKWRSKAEVEQIVPHGERERIPEAISLLTILHPGIHWLNAIQNTGLRGVLGYWGNISPSIDESSVRWTLRMLTEGLERHDPFIDAWRSANSAASVGWAALVRENATEDTLKKLTSGLPDSGAGWRYWDRFHEHEDPSAVYHERSQYSRSYRADSEPEFDSDYDIEAIDQGIPANFDVYNDGAAL
ncbi:hypothetical protein D1AOALGA4SA_2301 [Olavius algarvensis Delta 1 endosymbiont]|nr:hypothetical protein D1AOALGA4SA_2301 [Olavius algarvensis Delta 1 endosymbiont]